MSPTNLYADDSIGNVSVGGGSVVTMDTDGTLSIDGITTELSTDNETPLLYTPPIGSAIYAPYTGSATNQGTTDNTTGRIIPIRIPGPMTFDALFSRVDVVGGPSEISYFALYRPIMGGGIELIGDMDNYVPTSVANFGIVFGSPVPVVKPGLHYVVWVNEGSTNTARLRSHSVMPENIWTHDPATLGVNQSPSLNVATPRSGGNWATTITTGFTQIQSTNNPLIMMRRSA